MKALNVSKYILGTVFLIFDPVSRIF